WDFKRLAFLAQATLLSIVNQVKYLGLEKKIGINVAVNFAKQNLNTDDYKYINAILDNVL
ncbi:MAG: hypothetical protein LBR37_00400, partial [Erysipelotrichaceae bacterium]|nr:hypothetical protein [Erysipelotrichaceae bacterium]